MARCNVIAAHILVAALAVSLLLLGRARGQIKWRKGASPIHGSGVFATVALEAGQEVDCVAYQASFDIDTLRASRQLVKVTAFGQLVNHSRRANAVVRKKGHGQWWLYANTAVQPGEELVADYNARSHPWFLSGAPPDWA